MCGNPIYTYSYNVYIYIYNCTYIYICIHSPAKNRIISRCYPGDDDDDDDDDDEFYPLALQAPTPQHPRAVPRNADVPSGKGG